MKKRIIYTTIGLCSVILLSACSASKSNDNSKSNKQLTVAVDKLYVKYMNDIKKDFEKENKIKLNVKVVDQSDVITNLPTDGPTGAGPDVLMAPYDRVGGLSTDGHISEIKLKNSDQYEEKLKQLVTIDGKIYGAPNVIETLVLYYNKEFLKGAPKTFEELEALQNDPKYSFETEKGKNTAFLANWTNFYFAYGLTAGYGGYAFGENGTKASDIGLAANDSQKALEYAKQWYDTWPKGMQDTTKAGNFVKDQFLSKKTAAIIEGPWVAASLKEAKLNFGVSEIPVLPNGKKYSPFAGGKAWVVSNYSKNKKASEKFISFVTSFENQKKFYDSTQEIPATTKAREYALDQKNELTTAVIKQFNSSKPMPNIPEMAEVWGPSATMYFDAVSGKKIPQNAIRDALKTIKDTIEQKYGKN
ncbi:extracellular solute-binding protein [Streptococcus parauberis]|uniref:Maltodextrin-binding protein n=1 Tax=Streptococcus parauberis NCFD 2020 TaxID=873447 RepID=F1YXA3_9STRE|nr:extracellular solute-binding protein [Streptococcus parauberis]EGE53447.1 maltodextrin-binding protein MdxE [Streptococcus parauberis NCFD 2020]PNY18592.1 Maltose/maltodextrin-binding protein precursor [Streptococcus parauberis]